MSDAGLMMQYDAQNKSAVIAYLLWFFAGPLGAHRFYLGKTGSAVMLRILTVVCPFVLALALIPSASGEEASLLIIFLPWAGVAVWWLIDFLLVPGITRKYNSQLAQRLGQS